MGITTRLCKSVIVCVSMLCIWSYAGRAVAQGYVDVQPTFWAYEHISTLDRVGFNIRCTESPRRFCPSDILQGAVMVAWLSKARSGVDYRPPAATGNRFTDMPASHWAAGWAEDIDRQRIYRGCGDQSRFCPTGLLTRAQFAFVMVRARYGADFRPAPATGVYTDVPADHWAAAHIEQLKRDGVVAGCRDQSDAFCPSEAISRASAAVWMVRQFDIGGGGNNQYTEATPPRSNESLANPHRGFMFWGSSSYQTDPDNDNSFTYIPDDPFSTNGHVYHVYVSWRDVEPTDQNFDWDKLERQRLLPIMRNDPAATFVLRVVADYPGGASQGSSALYSGGDRDRDFPQFIIDSGIRTEGYGPAYNRPVCAEVSGGSGITPDWNDSRMVTQLQQLIAAFGARFDGDPRITAIQSGTVGLWGEGHQWSCPHDIGIGDAVKVAVREAYNRAFTKTPVQTRYPGVAEVTGVEFGFYEDYFPTFTVRCANYPEFSNSCSDGGDWNLDYGYRFLTPASVDNWKSNPVSGESPLGTQQSFWINKTNAVTRALREYHFSFLGPAGAHNGINGQVLDDMPADQRGNPGPYMRQKLAQMQGALGYRLHVDKAKWPVQVQSGASFDLTLTLANSGSAPVYQDNLAIEVSLVNSQGQQAWRALWSYPLTQVLPNQAAVVKSRDFRPVNLAAGDYSLRLAIASDRQGRLDGLVGQSRGPGGVFHSGPRDSSGRVVVGQIRLQ